MSLAIGDEHELLADAVARFAAQRCTPAVARAAMESDAAELPPFWAELDGLGWLTHAPADGLGFSELAIVLEGLGRAVAPGPILATAWARAVAGLADVEIEGPAAVAAAPGAPTLGGAAAGAVVRATAPADGSIRSLVPAADLERTSQPGLDATQGLATFDGDADGTPLAGVTDQQVEAIGIVLAAAEAIGGTSWCVETAAAWARDRRQFGRPIGQFQGVKHRCADMLVRLEAARAAVWDAAAALDGDDPWGDAAQVAVATAGALALDAFVDDAKDCIQVLGGIGFTWEHDAHLYLRRATALRQLFGGHRRWRARLATAAIAGTRRHLTLDLPPEAEAFRADIAAAIDAIAALPKEERRGPMADAGLIVPHWPEPWGRGAGAVEQVVIDQELRRAKVRAPHLQVGAWAAPTIAAHGTPEQQERWVRPTLHGEISWCQLFSEPEAGSDLAALATAATRAPGDDGWLLNGQKVWTTMAKEADWGICLARTNPTAPKHQGISYLIVDMRSDGIDIRPLRELTGMEMFNEVFFDDCFVPDDCVIGEVDGGWPLARTTLANERVSMGSGSSFGGGIEALIGLVAERIADGQLDGEDPILLDGLGALVAEAHALAVMGLRTAARSLSGAQPGPEASVRKLLGVEHDQRTQEAGLSLLGPEGATVAFGAPSQWTFGFLANRCLTIAGGTSEIQRNVIGERLLGLPRDPEPSPSGATGG
ncbi:MAG: acyl-CoA dehydrogenase family protein [Acidimicrobiales bacterium]